VCVLWCPRCCHSVFASRRVHMGTAALAKWQSFVPSNEQGPLPHRGATNTGDGRPRAAVECPGIVPVTADRGQVKARPIEWDTGILVVLVIRQRWPLSTGCRVLGEAIPSPERRRRICCNAAPVQVHCQCGYEAHQRSPQIFLLCPCHPIQYPSEPSIPSPRPSWHVVLVVHRQQSFPFP